MMSACLSNPSGIGKSLVAAVTVRNEQQTILPTEIAALTCETMNIDVADDHFSDSSSDAADEEFWDLAISSSEGDLNVLEIMALQDNGRRKRGGSVTGRIYKNIHHVLWLCCFCMFLWFPVLTGVSVHKSA